MKVMGPTGIVRDTVMVFGGANLVLLFATLALVLMLMVIYRAPLLALALRLVAEGRHRPMTGLALDVDPAVRAHTGSAHAALVAPLEATLADLGVPEPELTAVCCKASSTPRSGNSNTAHRRRP